MNRSWWNGLVIGQATAHLYDAVTRGSWAGVFAAVLVGALMLLAVHLASTYTLTRRGHGGR